MYYLLDKTFKFIAPVENYNSMIWTNRFYSPGDFELIIPANSENMELYKEDFYIVRDDDYTQMMIIDTVQLDTNRETGDVLSITGKSLKSILNRRVIWGKSTPQVTVSDSVEDCIRTLITDNMIKPLHDSEHRKISNLSLGDKINVTDEIQKQYNGENLETAVSELCNEFKIGYDVLFDLDKKTFTFVLLKGADRSYNQADNPRIIFSNEFENLLSTNYIATNVNYKNAVYVGGEGEGIDRSWLCEHSDYSGIDRREVFVDSKNTSSKSNETLTDAEYEALLSEEGKKALTEYIKTEAVEGDIIVNHTWTYGTDYFLGDTVELINEYGKALQPQIIEVIESESENGKEIILTFATE